MTRSLLAALAAGLAFATAAVAQHAPSPTQASSAVATLRPLGGSNVAGTVVFTRDGDRVMVRAEVRGLPPGGHGFHIHERGDCSAPDGMSAGGHFNPTGKPHGNPGGGDHHAGDLPMLEADARGDARLSVAISAVTLDQSSTGMIGRAFVVHADPDDYASQPSGNAGARIACGVLAAR